MISEPDRGAASTTTVPRLIPAMIRLRYGKWRALGSVPGGISASTSPRSAIARLPVLILGRVEDVDATGDDPDGAAVERTVVGGAVDAAGEARDDDGARAAQGHGQVRGQSGTPPPTHCARRRSRPRPLEQAELALGHQQRRRVVHLREEARIEALPEDDVARAELLDPFDLPLGIGAAEQARRSPAAAPGEIGHRGQRRRGIAEPREQLAKSDRADARRTDQPQPIDQVVVHTLPFPMRGSVPAWRRTMFVRCFQMTSNAKPSSIGK